MIKKYKGFTLIELLVVITILGILASIITVSVAGAALKSRDSRRKADLDVIKKAVSLYSIDNGSYPLGDTIGYALCSTQSGSTGMKNWNVVEQKVSKYLDQGNLPRDPKEGCSAGNDTGQDGTPAYSYITNATTISSIPNKFSIWTYLEYKKDKDSNSFGDTISLTISNEVTGSQTVSSGAKGKYKNTFYYPTRVQEMKSDIHLETSYAVGTAK